jgi:hypothetical protein
MTLPHGNNEAPRLRDTVICPRAAANAAHNGSMKTPEGPGDAGDAPAGAPEEAERELPDEVREILKEADGFRTRLSALLESIPPSERTAARRSLYIDGDGQPATRHNRLRSVPSSAPPQAPSPLAEDAAGEPLDVTRHIDRSRRPRPRPS